MDKYILKLILLFSFIVNSSLAFSNDGIKHKGNPTGINWNNITEKQFLENLVLCQLKLNEYKWSKTNWPKENKRAKPSYTEVVDLDSVITQVETSIKKQSLLESHFNVSITSELLQNDLIRMAQNTKDPEELTSLFSFFGNNPLTISYCVSRPYLINKMFNHKYYWSNEIHGDTFNIAQNELSESFATKQANQHQMSVHPITFELSDDEELSHSEDEDVMVIKLNTRKFQEKLIEANKKTLIEKEKHIIYYEILEQTDNSLVLNKYIWQKQTANQWLLKQNPGKYHFDKINHDLKLPIIKSNKPIFKNGTNYPANSWKPNNKIAPEERMEHSAVWTGTEMIIWGGTGSDGSLINTGGRYNPTTDTWIQTSTNGAPTGRIDNSAIWTGNEMLIWGGSGDNENKLNSGVRYNPITDTWTPMTTIGSPTNRSNHTAVWANDKMIIYGGIGVDELNNEITLETGAIYYPDLDSWSDVSLLGAPTKRKYFCTIWTGTEMIVWGGQGDDGQVLNSGGRYNPETDQWTPTENINSPTPRSSSSAVWTGSEMIIWGGFVPFSPGSSSGSALDTGARYNPISGSWIELSSTQSPPALSGSEAIWTGTEMIIWNTNFSTGGLYDPDSDSWRNISPNPIKDDRHQSSVVWTGTEMIVWGGYDLVPPLNIKTYNDGVKYNPLNDTWTETNLTNAPTGRIYHTAIWTGVEMIVWGGSPYSSGGRYDPTTDSWSSTTTTGAPLGRFRHSAIWTGTEMIVWGGEGIDEFDSGGRYNPILNTWTPTSTSGAPTPRERHSAVWTGSNMIIWGGRDFESNMVNTGGIYDPNSDTWSPTTTMNASLERYYHTAVWTGSEMIIWGGVGNYTSGSRYNPNTDSWTTTNSNGEPESRYLHTAIWSGEEMIIWGGYSGTRHNTGGRYNPVSDNWSAINMINTPSARSSHTMVLADQELIIWGGYSGTDPLNTGGRYKLNSNTWAPTDIDTAPPGRNLHKAVWTGSEMLVWGGFDTSYSPYVEIYYPYNNIIIDFIYSNGFESE